MLQAAVSFNGMPKNHIKKGCNEELFSNPGKKGSVTIIYAEIGMCQTKQQAHWIVFSGATELRAQLCNQYGFPMENKAGR